MTGFNSTVSAPPAPSHSRRQPRGNGRSFISIPKPTEEKIKPAARRPACAWKVAPDLLSSFKYAWAGVRYAFTTQRNFRIHTAIGVLATSLGACLHVSAAEMAVLALTIAMVMAVELLNTAIESAVDLTVKRNYHELAKIAKDCAAGAVLVVALAALAVASFILLPPLVVAIAAWF